MKVRFSRVEGLATRVLRADGKGSAVGDRSDLDRNPATACFFLARELGRAHLHSRDNTRFLALTQNESLLARPTHHRRQISVQITLTPESSGACGVVVTKYVLPASDRYGDRRSGLG